MQNGQALLATKMVAFDNVSVRQKLEGHLVSSKFSISRYVKSRTETSLLATKYSKAF